MKLNIKYEVANGKVVMDEADFIKVLCDLALLRHLRNIGVDNWSDYENPGFFPRDYDTVEELVSAIEKFDE